MGTFRRSRSPGALPLIPALMDSFRKLNTRYRTPGVGEGGRGGGGRARKGVLDPTMADTGRLLQKGVLYQASGTSKGRAITG